MAWTQSDLDAINAAIASGELVVQYEDKKVTYRSIGELLRARAVIKAEVSSSTIPTRRRYGDVKTGW